MPQIGNAGAEGATAPESLRQMDRRGDETLESRWATYRDHGPLTEDVTRPSPFELMRDIGDSFRFRDRGGRSGQ